VDIPLWEFEQPCPCESWFEGINEKLEGWMFGSNPATRKYVRGNDWQGFGMVHLVRSHCWLTYLNRATVILVL
jgi:hypothetical protein